LGDVGIFVVDVAIRPRDGKPRAAGGRSRWIPAARHAKSRPACGNLTAAAT